MEDEGIAVDESAETDEEPASHVIIGGADGPTSIFLAGKFGGADGTALKPSDFGTMILTLAEMILKF